MSRTVTVLFALVVGNLIWNAQLASDELDKATREHMQHHADELSKEMTWLLQEQEQRNQEEQNSLAWGVLLFASLQQWQFWAVAGAMLLVLLFGLCWGLRKRSHEVDSSSDEQSSSIDREQVEEEAEEEDNDSANDLERFSEEHIQWLVQNLADDCQVVKDLVGSFILVFREPLSNSFFPGLQPAIEVRSAFEGWSPHEKDIINHLLVTLKPCCGHTFHLELGTTGEMPARKFCVRVELECTCMKEQLAGDMLCFFHHPKEELRRNQDPSLLHTLCTGFYLDVQKTAHWFQNFVREAWEVLPLSLCYSMKVLPSTFSCKLQLKNASRTLFFEMMFGVQQGNSDIFVRSQNTEDITPSTTWPESCAVAEVKFFRHKARRVPQDSFHLKCLQACTLILVGTVFSTQVFSTLKTVVMHLLITIHPSGWHRRDFLLRLEDIMQYLHCCLEKKRLIHFSGNERVPEGRILPPAFQMAKPLNLFQHLMQNPVAHAKALHVFTELQYRPTRLQISQAQFISRHSLLGKCNVFFGGKDK